jgi:hypothetical protein
MASDVFICNLALSNVGKSNISSMNEAGAEARACRQYYEHVRDLCLGEYPWHFAGKTASLAEVANDRPGSWGYAYRLPTDCLKERFIRPEDTEAAGPVPDMPMPFGYPYEIEGDVLYSDLSPCFLRYTFRLTNPAKFSPWFVDYMGWALAVRLAMPLTRDPKVRADAWQVASRVGLTAQALDANRVRNTSDHESELVSGR